MKFDMKIEEKELLITKAKNRKLNDILLILFVLSFLWVVLYQFILLKIPAINEFYYDLGVVVNTVIVSYVTGYIFYYLTTILPENDKNKKMQGVVKLTKQELSKQLDYLMIELTREEDWVKLNKDDIKTQFDKISKNRLIWKEDSMHLSFPNGELLMYRPKTLEVLHSTIKNLNFLFQDIVNNASYFNLTYLENIIWIKNSRLYNQLNTFIPQNIDISTVSMKGDTLLDHFFTHDLSLYLRTNILDKDPNNEVFLDKIKSLHTMSS